jgi:hypothetical protein
MNKKKLYIGCALTNLSSEKRDELLKNISSLRERLEDKFEVLEFLWVKMDPSKATPDEVYRVDIDECVKSADCMLALCDYPSTGLGYEMATALEKCGIPVLAVAQKDSVVTKLVRGINKPNFNFQYYDSFDEVGDMVLKFL